jgi:hypothetical protein
VADGVLDQRLQREARHQTVEAGRSGLEAHAEPVAEPQPLEVQVRLDEAPFLAQRQLVDALALNPQAVAKQVAQALQGLFGDRRFASDESHQRVEGVEDEVRVELGAQRLELGPSAERLGARGARGLLAAVGGVVPRIGEARERGIDHHVVQHPPGQGARVEAQAERSLEQQRVEAHEQRPARAARDHVREQQPGLRRVEARTRRLGPRQPARQPRDRDAEQRVGQQARQGVAQRDVEPHAVGDEGGQIGREREQPGRSVDPPRASPTGRGRRDHAHSDWLSFDAASRTIPRPRHRVNGPR